MAKAKARPKATKKAQGKAKGQPARRPAPEKRAPKAKAKAAARTIERELLVKAPPERVWRLWTTKQGLESWLAKEAVVELREGGRFELHEMGGYEGVTASRVLDVGPGRRLALEWEPDAKWGPTRVEVTVAAAKGGTRITLVQSGFGDGPEWDEWYDGFDGGWALLMARLFVAVEGAGVSGGRARRAATCSERLAAAPADVWKALATAKGLARWFAGPGGTLEARTGGAYRLPAGPTEIAGAVRECVPGRALSLTWDVEPCTGQKLPAATLVSFTLAPGVGGRGTRVCLVHSGFGDGPEWDAIYARHAETWKWLLSNLRTAVDLSIDQRGRRYERSLLLRAAPGDVWALLATRAGLKRWLVKDVKADLRAGGKLDVNFGGEGGCGRSTWPVVEVETARRLVLTVFGFGGLRPPSPPRRSARRGMRSGFRALRQDGSPASTLVELRLDPVEDGAATRFTIVQSGFGDGPGWDAAYRDWECGWDECLGRIHAILEGHGKKGRQIARSVELAAPPAKAWELVATADGLRRWMPTVADLEPVEGRSVTLQIFGASVSGEVRAVEPGRSIAYTWTMETAAGKQPAPTLATFILAPGAGGGTRVTLVHSGFGAGPDWDGDYEGHGEGWRHFLANLKTVADHGVDRRRGRRIERSVAVAAPPERVFARLSKRFAGATVLESDPGRRLELLRPTAPDRHATIVAFELQAEGAGTKLALLHSGFDSDPAWDGVHGEAVESWERDLRDLRSRCERRVRT